MICFVLVLKLEFVSFNGFVWSMFRAAKNHQKAYERLLISFDLFLSFFTDCGHTYVPNGMFWGSTSRPHIEDLVMSLYKNGPFWTKMAKHGRLVNTPKWSKRVRKGP